MMFAEGCVTEHTHTHTHTFFFLTIGGYIAKIMLLPLKKQS